jgi:hypothetical protein
MVQSPRFYIHYFFQPGDEFFFPPSWVEGPQGYLSKHELPLRVRKLRTAR